MPGTRVTTIDEAAAAMGFSIEDEPKNGAPIAEHIDHSKFGSNGFDAHDWVKRYLAGNVADEKRAGESTIYTLKECPFNSDHRAPDSAVIVNPNGAPRFRCLHNSCSHLKWRDLRQKFEPGCYDLKEFTVTKPRSLRQLVVEHPELNQPMINGLLRRAELGNLVSETKLGKSWLLLHIAIQCVRGDLLWNRFLTTPGRVLILDNELHGGTIANRAFKVGDALNVLRDSYQDSIHYEVLRGRRLDIHQIGKYLEQFKAGDFDYVFLDALYRAWPYGQSENENTAWTDVQNSIEAFAERLQVAWLTVHHSTKGTQGEKRVTDVGSGGSSQSRAADAHIVIRQHETPGVAVVDAALRSFKPIDPFCLRWDYPLWIPADDCDPTQLKTSRPTSKAAKAAADANDPVKPSKFEKAAADALALLLTMGPSSKSKWRNAAGVNSDRINAIVEVLLERKQIELCEVETPGGKFDGYKPRSDGSTGSDVPTQSGVGRTAALSLESGEVLPDLEEDEADAA